MEFLLNFLPGAGLVVGVMGLAVYLGLRKRAQNANPESSRRVYLYVSVAAFSVSFALLVYLNVR
jgi:FtsH-binding integral membrane protein